MNANCFQTQRRKYSMCQLFCCTRGGWHPWFAEIILHFTIILHKATHTHSRLSRFIVSQSIKASQGSIMTHCSEIEGQWWPGLIVSEPCLLGWTESLLIYIRLIPAATFVSTLVTKERCARRFFAPKSDWSHSTQIPAEERHYYLCSGAQWHISEALWRSN